MNVDELFDAPPDQFVAARDRLAKELKDAGRRDEAQEVKSLRRPTASVWAVNQLARKHPDDVARLLDASGAVARSQAESRDATEIRRASAERREAIAGLTQIATTLLEDAGLSTTRTNLDKVTTTLMSTGSDPRIDDLIRSGRLTEDASLGGLDATLSMAGSVDDVTTAAPADRRRLQKNADRLRNEAEDAEAHAKELALEAEQAGRVADQARSAAAEARRRAEELRRAAHDATARLTEP